LLSERFLSPDQSPDATQLLAFSVVQVSRVEPLYATFSGLADKLTSGPDIGGLTNTSTWSVTEPPEPVQVRLKLVFEDKEFIVCEPEPLLFPDQPPAALQLFVLVVVQVKVVDPL
jgi:hypothetical protein